MRLPTKSLDILAVIVSLFKLPSAAAFRDTSPFFFYISSDNVSSTNIPSSSPAPGISTTSEFISTTKNIISQCKSDAYILVTQPGIHASDFKNGKCVPHLKGTIRARSQMSLELPYGRQVANEDEDGVVEVLERWAVEKCGAKLVEVDPSTGTFQRFDDMKPKVVKVDFPEIVSDDDSVRSKALADADTFLFSVMALLPTDKWTLVYTSSPRRVMHTSTGREHDLHYKKEQQVTGSFLSKRENVDASGTGGLFKRYRFFTPGVFMGYLASFFLLTIGYVALNAVSNLKVSYGAFEKDVTGKKQQ